jgi:hypothetical protein
MFSTILLAASALAIHEMKVVIAADNNWKMNVDGIPFFGPMDGADGIRYSWKRVTSKTVPLKGEGPWVVGIEAHDWGVIAGLFSSIFLDGQPYTATGNITTQFKASDTAASNWLDVDFNDNDWKTGSAINNLDCLAGESLWGGQGGQLFTDLNAQSPGLPIHASWFPKCRAVNKKLFFRVLVRNPVASNPVRVVDHRVCPL